MRWAGIRLGWYAECGNERLMVTYYLCWQCAGLCRVIWAIYSPRYKNKEMTNKYAEGAHCFPLARLPKLLLDLSSAGPKPALNRLSLSAHALTQVNLWPQHLVFLSFKLRSRRQSKSSIAGIPCRAHMVICFRLLYSRSRFHIHVRFTVHCSRAVTMRRTPKGY